MVACCGLAWDKARPWAKRLSWQTQGGRVRSLGLFEHPGLFWHRHHYGRFQRWIVYEPSFSAAS